MSKKKKKNDQKKNVLSLPVIIAAVIALIAVAGIVVACVFLLQQPSETNASQDASQAASSAPSANESKPSYAETSYEEKEEYPYVQIEMEDGGKIVLELYPEIAPITVQNFLDLAGSGFYDGLIFHRVMSGFMIQGGDPEGTGYGGSEKTIKGEFSENGVENNLSHQRGVISMARSKSMDSASSQFFICHADASASLDGKYAAFGRVVSGMDVVDKIASVETNSKDRPLIEQKMKKVTVLKSA